MARPERPRSREPFADRPTLSLAKGPGPDTPPVAQDAPPPRQFLPGTRLGKRYRIVELLGRGGMGEVYRADDLQLGQPVALKFLPAHLTDDPTALARLRNEVRVARQVAHGNVCRVYDIGEADGQIFLSMEYIDGEDLRSVLRRLGRPTLEKSIEIARQLCTGLAAAHESGVLHRDLKPANVMIDGRGRARITDFGLASFAREQTDEGTSGTPSYMAPELFSGHAASTRTDIYALGAVLYELFTGHRALDADSLSGFRKLQASGKITLPSELVQDLPPVIEQIILRCLDRDPMRRPVSAIAVAAVLPGQDLVQAALAAGQTPSPEMVAAAGGTGALRPAIAGACLAATLGGLLLVAGLNRIVSLSGLAPPTKPAVVLADQARGILERIGHPPPVDRAYGWEIYHGYLGHVAKTDERPDRWFHLRDRRPPIHWLWYRESPRPMVARNNRNEVWFHDPPLVSPGMAGIKLDDRGRLAVLQVVPPQVAEPQTEPPPDYQYGWLFEAAGLDMADFEEAEPRWNPRDYADRRVAWTGHYPEQPDWPVRVEAATFLGSPIYFNVLETFDEPMSAGPDDRGVTERLAGWINVSLLALALIMPPLVARRNLRQGNGDRSGAMRLGMFVFWLGFLSWTLAADHVSDLKAETDMLLVALGLCLLLGVWSALIYLALEPYVRRLWPRTMISWTRLLMGRVTDPRVGRDVLCGGLAAVVILLAQRLEFLVPYWLGVAPRRPLDSMQAVYLGGRKALAEIFEPFMLQSPLMVLLVLTALLFVLRRQWLAAIAAAIVFILVDGHLASGDERVIVQVCALIEVVVVWALLLFVLIRFGLLALVSSFFFVGILQKWPLTLDMSLWFSGTSLVGLLLLAAVAVVATRISLGRRKLGDPAPVG